MATLGNITFYADDPRALSAFWAQVFGYPPMDWDDRCVSSCSIPV